MNLVYIITIIAFFSIGFELVFLHVPSVASVYQLCIKRASISTYLSKPLEKGILQHTINWPFGKKLLFIIIPTGISIITGLFPLICSISVLFYNRYYFEPLPVFNAIGCILIILGRTFTIFATLDIRKKNNQEGDSFMLKQQGFFKISRNPLLLGMYVMYTGMALLFFNYAFYIGLIIYFSNMHYRLLVEEDFLQQLFGEAYKQYKASTNRYL